LCSLRSDTSFFCGVRKEADVLSLTEEAKKLQIQDKIIPILMDVVNDDQIDAVVKQVAVYLNTTGLPVLGIVSNAGVSSRFPLETVPMDEVRRIFEVNFFGSLALVQKFLPLVRQSQGRIVFISSMAALAALKGNAIYSASKRAIEAVVDSLRMEMLPFGVSVTSVLPGYVKSSISDKHISNYKEIISEELYKIYESHFESIIENRNKNLQNIPGPHVTSEAIVHALTDPYPYTRYYVGSTGEYPVKVVPILTSILPDRMGDLFKKNK